MTFWERAGMLKIAFKPRAAKELAELAANPQLLARVRMLLKDASAHPFSGLGKPEPLKHQLRGYWSRRIDAKSRLVYRVVEPDLIVISLIGHYS